jgi:glycosyltransferase involved in cell wall biosynthesis
MGLASGHPRVRSMVQGQCDVIKVGFLITFGPNDWLGGVSYYRNLFRAVSLLADRKIEPVIFAGTRTEATIPDGFSSFEIVRTGLLDEKPRPGLLHRLVRKAFPVVLKKDIHFQRLLAKHNIAIVSHTNNPFVDFGVPTIGWIADFQHKRLPDYFSKKELVERDRIFNEMCRSCAGVVVSSHDAQGDLKEFFPEGASKSRVLQFVASVPPGMDIIPLEELENRYRFRGPYFFLPNHFWVHKNHRIVVEALKILKSRGYHTPVLVSGKTHAYQKPDYFDALMEDVEKHDLTDCFRPLGVITYQDVLSLMYHSVSLINPSLFEGWSNTVEEAKSLGKGMILSDIPVHREQAHGIALFFGPRDPESLSEVMAQAWDRRDSAVRLSAHQLAEDLDRRLTDFAKTYESIVMDVLKQGRQGS